MNRQLWQLLRSGNRQLSAAARGKCAVFPAGGDFARFVSVGKGAQRSACRGRVRSLHVKVFFSSLRPAALASLTVSLAFLVTLILFAT